MMLCDVRVARHRHDGAVADASVDQVPGKLVGLAVELRISQLLRGGERGHRRRCPARLFFEDPRQGGGERAWLHRSSQRLGDHFEHDLVYSAVDPLDPGVDVEVGHRVVGHIAIAAEELQALVDDLALHVTAWPAAPRRGWRTRSGSPWRSRSCWARP